MQKIFSLIAISYLFVFFGFTQTIQQNNASQELIKSCGFDMIHNQKLNADANYARKVEEFNQLMQGFSENSLKVSNTNLRVPVVVHVMETGGSLTEISDQEIQDAIKSLNERFRKVPGSLGDADGVDSEIEFALAVRDPSGNCTNGIVRVDMTSSIDYMNYGVEATTANGITDTELKAFSFWNSNDYYNIWIVSEIDDNNGGGGIQGYAYFASAHGLSYDGTVILNNSFKNKTATTLTHELGHAFNLYHTFEGDVNGTVCPPNIDCNLDGDQCCDTPPHIRTLYTCPTGQTNSCTGGSSDAFIHNYMDYSSDDCQDEFTGDQRTRAQAAMTIQRSSFLEINGNNSLIPPVAPTVDFIMASDFVCNGTDLQLYDVSSCVPNTYLDTTYWDNISFSWTFDNGTSTYTSTLQNPLMSLPVGSYDITLAITTTHGTSQVIKTDAFVVGTSPVVTCTPSSSNEGNFAQTVNQVVFNTLSNITSSITNVAYTDFSCDANTIVTKGNTYSLDVTIRAGGSGPEVVETYIDYNNNGVFEATEQVLSGSTATNTTSTISETVTIPAGAAENALLTMRVYGETNTLDSDKISCNSSLLAGDVEDYGVYIMPESSPLPVELLSFNAKLISNDVVQLDWETSSEVNNDFFSVERSRNGEYWSDIEKIEGAGNSTSTLSYQTFDYAPLEGISYYRLKQTDFNGDYTYYPIRSISTNDAGEIVHIFPNPTQNKVTITASPIELTTLKIINALGQTIQIKNMKLEASEKSVEIDLSNLSKGIYFIQTKTQTNRIIKD